MSATEKPPATAPQPLTATAAAEKSDIELDQDLFFPVATQLGQENETVRNLLIDAEHKIGELELIKNSIGKLVDPVSKTLRAYEETKSEKLSLQNVLNTTRIAHNKLRDDLGNAEKKARSLEAETLRLRDILAAAQQTVAAHEKTKGRAARRARRAPHPHRRAAAPRAAAGRGSAAEPRGKPPARRARRHRRQADGAA